MICEVIGIGVSIVDHLIVIPSFPVEDTKMRAVSCVRQGGGPAATAIVALAKLGVKTAYISRIGNDEAGRLIKEDLKQYGVITDYIVEQRNVSTPVAFVLVNETNGKRTIIWNKETFSTQPVKLDKKLISSAKFLHLDGHYPEIAFEAVKTAKNSGVKVSLDAGDVYPEIDKLISLTDILITSNNFPSDFLGEADLDKAAKELFEMGPEIVVITLGEDGCLCISKKGIFRQPAFKVNVVDTTGAGDAFHGAFIYGLLKKWNIQKTAEFSCAVAAINCAKLGGRIGLPTKRETENFIENYKKPSR